MRFGLVLPNFGPLADTRELITLARAAERSFRLRIALQRVIVLVLGFPRLAGLSV